MHQQLLKFLIKHYFFQACIVATLAYTLYFWYAVACNIPIGASTLVEGYFYGYFFHFPPWLLLYLVCGIFSNALLKIYKRILRITLILIAVLFVIPIVFKLGLEYWDYTVPFLSLINFLFCYAIFIYFRKTFNFGNE